MTGIGGHHNPMPRTNDYQTPPEIVRALGQFDLDPCASLYQHSATAEKMLTEHDDGLSCEWAGRVWLNPPYERRVIDEWMLRMAEHGEGAALVFARTEVKWFCDYVWGAATAALFLAGRLHFYTPEGRSVNNSGAPSVLVAYGDRDAQRLKNSGLPGGFVWIGCDDPSNEDLV